MNLLEALQWRAAIKKFDTTKKVSNEDLEKLLEAGNLAATSGGLQPFKIVVLNNDALQTELVPHSYGQAQVKDASHVLIFSVETIINEQTVDAYVNRAAEVRGKDKEALIGYSDSMKAYMTSMDEAQKYAWARNQAYIALGTVLAEAATLKIDSCPMEGFNAAEYQKLLGLADKNLMPVAILPIGYRSDADVHSKEAKVRKTRANFVVEI